MKRRMKKASAILAVGVMFLLILDTQTATAGAAEGIELCIKVLIPSLFPFFIVTTYLNASLTGLRIPGLRTIGKFLNFPTGSESVLLLGLLGGYPVGAQLIADAYAEGKISKRNAQILLGYCSNAGPAFIFGVTSTLFHSLRVSFILWGILILSALITGVILPKPEETSALYQKESNISVVAALKKSIITCASVCGWVVTFKIIMAYLVRLTGNNARMIYLAGLLELSNGCLLLTQIVNNATRFILCSAFLSFGGICVLMQTASVTDSLGLGLYIPGKLIQTSVSVLAASLLSFVLFSEVNLPLIHVVFFGLICILILIAVRTYAEKSCGNTMKNNV